MTWLGQLQDHLGLILNKVLDPNGKFPKPMDIDQMPRKSKKRSANITLLCLLYWHGKINVEKWKKGFGL